MRILKKSMAITLVVAMVLGLMSFGAFAAETNDMALKLVASKASVGQGQSITVELQLKSNTGSAINLGMTGVYVTYDAEKWDVVNATGEGMLYYNAVNTATAGAVKNQTMSGGSLTTEFVTAGKYTFTAKAEAAVGAAEFGLSNINFSNSSAGILTKDTPEAVAITIVETAVINTVTAPAAISDKTIGTAVADLGLPSTVVVATATKESPVGQNVNVAWDTTAYDAAVLTAQTFTGTVTTGNDAWTLAGDFVAPTVTVTLQAATDGVVSAPANVTVQATKEDETFDLAAYKAIAGDAIELEVAKGEIKDTVAIDDAWITVTDFDTTVADTTAAGAISITIPANTMSKANLFKIAETTLTADVNVVPAEIAVEAITIENTTASSRPTVKTTIPANAVAAGEVTISVEFLKPVTEGESTVWEVVDTVAATATAVADEATVVEVKADATLEAMGFASAGDVFAVKVLANDATLKVGEALQVQDKVMVTFSDAGSVGGIGVSQGNVKLPEKTEEPKEEPGTEEPGTEEPGTEEPGTEEPGTEEPGTEEPGTVEPVAPFEDITEEYAWAAESIATLKDLGVVSGVDGANFKPDADITRAEFTKMVAVLFGLEVGATDTHFADCAAGEWYTPYIVAATEAGFINGVSDAEFAPDATITREQACAILGRALKVAGEGELTFTDAAEVEEYAKAAIAALAEMGIVNGYEDGSFAPANNITRAEAAKIMAGAYAKIAPVEEAPAE